MSDEGACTGFSLADVLEVLGWLDAAGIAVWLDGGWGVDALLGGQTRAHADLDIVVQASDLPALRRLLAAQGFADHPRDDTRAWNFVLADSGGRQIDVHVVVLDEQGNGSYGPPEHGEMYPASALAGQGRLAGREVACIAAQDAVRFHSGYALTAKDYADVAALCKRFGIAFPAEYEPFRS